MALPPSLLYRFLHTDPKVLHRRLVKAGIWDDRRTRQELADAMAAHQPHRSTSMEPPGMGPPAFGPSSADELARVIVAFVNETGMELSRPHVSESELSEAARNALRSLVPWHRRIWRALTGR